MTDERERLRDAERRMRVLLDMLAEYEKRGATTLAAIVLRAVPDAARDIQGASQAMLRALPVERRRRRSKWEVSADAAA